MTPVRLTIINQYYVPDISPTAHLAASLAEHRAARGDEVTVIASRGGYANPSLSGSVSQQPSDLRIRYVWTPQLGKRRKLFRVLDYGAFYIGAALRILLMQRQDLIVSLTTPPFIAGVAALHKLLHRRSKLILWNMDCYPEIAERTGVLRHNGWLSRAMRAANRWLFARIDYLVSLDGAMEELLVSQYAPRTRQLSSALIPNWERLSLFPKDAEYLPGPTRAGFDGRPFTVLYLGNAGYGHSFTSVLEAARILRSEPVSFVFVGGGVRWRELEDAIHTSGLTNVTLKGYVPKSETLSTMRAADCALITLHDFALGVMSPSKLHSNLAMGLPVLYVGPEGSNVDEAIRTYRCGVSIRNGRPEEIAEWIRRVMQSPDELSGLRERARSAFEQAYCDKQALSKFDGVIDALADPKALGGMAISGHIDPALADRSASRSERTQDQRGR